MTIPLKPLTTINCEGENDEKEYVEAAADHLVGCRDVYRASFNTGA
jgi:hypothetical protein